MYREVLPQLNVLFSVGHRTNIHIHSIFVGFCVCDGEVFCFIVVPKIQWIVTDRAIQVLRGTSHLSLLLVPRYSPG